MVGFSLVEERGRVIYGLMRRKWIGFRERSLPVAKDGDRYNLSSQLNRPFSSGLIALLVFLRGFLPFAPSYLHLARSSTKAAV